MNNVLYGILALIPLSIIVLVIYAIIKVLTRKNKGNIDYGRYSLNILENNTTTSKEL